MRLCAHMCACVYVCAYVCMCLMRAGVPGRQRAEADHPLARGPGRARQARRSASGAARLQLRPQHARWAVRVCVCVCVCVFQKLTMGERGLTPCECACVGVCARVRGSAGACGWVCGRCCKVCWRSWTCRVSAARPALRVCCATTYTQPTINGQQPTVNHHLRHHICNLSPRSWAAGDGVLGAGLPAVPGGGGRQ